MDSTIRPWLILIVSGTIWGVTFSLARMLVQNGAHPLGMNLWVAIFGTIVLSAILLIKRRPLPFDRAHLWFYLVCGLCGTVIPGTLLFYAAGHLPAGVLAITLGTVPLMTFIGALYFDLEGKEFRRILGVILGFAAILLIAAPETSLPDPGSRIWIVIAVLASLMYCAENMVIALKKPVDTDAFTVLCGMQILSSMLMLPIVWATDSFVPIGMPFDVWDITIVSMALINVFAYGSFIYLIETSGPLFASQMAYVVTLAGVFWGMWLLAESHSYWVWAALLVMITGLFLVQPKSDLVHE